MPPESRARQAALLLAAIHVFAFTAVIAMSAPRAHAKATQSKRAAQAAKTLARELASIDAKVLALAAREQGDAERGAIVFHRKQLTCTQCHGAGENHILGPDLTALGARVPRVTDTHLVTSILEPSKAISKGYETVVLESKDDIIVGFLVSEADDAVVVRDAAQNYEEVRVARGDIDDLTKETTSSMPTGLVNQLSSKQQFYDLVRYLIEIRDGGRARANALEPDPSTYADRPLPAYEGNLDHAGIIRDLDDAAFDRGKEIYESNCINCHGTRDEPGSLPTSLVFHEGRFRNGSDPFSMYQTLTRGFGLMAAQTWLVPSQKYDVIHYIRRAFLEEHNPSQHFAIDDTYLARLPEGTTRGPAPSKVRPWLQMDYGRNQAMSLEIGTDAKNFAYKANAIRLDPGPGGVARGRHFMVYDRDTMRVAAAWSSEGFIDWKCIHFDGSHNSHPRIVGDLHAENPNGPGWGRPGDGSFDDVRLVGRDDRRYGPLPRDWAKYEGMYHHGAETIVAYTVGSTRVLERPAVNLATARTVFTRTFNIGPRSTDLILQVAHCEEAKPRLESTGSTALFGAIPPEQNGLGEKSAEQPLHVSDASILDGATHLEVRNTDGMHVAHGDFTVVARIKTTKDGTILAITDAKPRWQADGLTIFIRRGRLTVDVGWVGAVTGARSVADGEWHDVVIRYTEASGEVRFYVDGRLDPSGGRLRRKKPLEKPVVRIGYTASNFPNPTFFDGEMAELRFYNSALDDTQIAAQRDANAASNHLAAHWDLTSLTGTTVPDVAGGAHVAEVVRGRRAPQPSARPSGFTVAGLAGETAGLAWLDKGVERGNLRLKIPAGDRPRRFTLWFTNVADRATARSVAAGLVLDEPDEDLEAKTHGGPARWTEVLTTDAIVGDSDGPFEVDVLTRPTDNPWFCRMRLTGFDFTADGKSAIVSTWDGSIWKVSGFSLPRDSNEARRARSIPIEWRRIASGLFQPLGVKIVGGEIYVTCRDQICILHDQNGDGEIDWYECFNSDHQVTEHFHEFAMGLQVDAQGNFYYAKSARHAKPALVPHHGTLLRVSKDGSRTEIVATGFRAANGVCINPDGSFIVTDQEGHWNPKNRINYVKRGGFYGNMYGYHDVTDTSDAAMEQPLVWITNAFDRSPGELLWVDSEKWGPLNGRLLNLSYGYGQVFIVPHEDVDGQMQGGMCAFPLERFPTGVMRGRFHPHDGQLYLAGMFAWAGSQTQPGGLYRLRYSGKPVHLPTELRATKSGMTIRFSGDLDAASASTASNYRVKVWSLERTKSYGSKHYDEHAIDVTSAALDTDRRTVHLKIPAIAPTWCMEIRYELRSAAGKRIDGRIHNTIHKLKD